MIVVPIMMVQCMNRVDSDSRGGKKEAVLRLKQQFRIRKKGKGGGGGGGGDPGTGDVPHRFHPIICKTNCTSLS